MKESYLTNPRGISVMNSFILMSLFSKTKLKPNLICVCRTLLLLFSQLRHTFNRKSLFITFLLVPLLPLFAATSKKTNEKEWTLETYVAEVLQSDEHLKEVQNKSLSLQANYKIPQIQSKTQLSLRPSWNKEFQFKGLTSAVTQTLPTGTSFEISETEYFIPYQTNLGAYDRSLTGSISQDLLRNFLGRNQKWIQKSAELKVLAEKTLLKFENLKICTQAVNKYLDLYQKQEQVKLYKQIETDSKKSLNLIKRLYRQRLINKIDFLSAQTDFIETQKTVRDLELAYTSSQTEASKYISKPIKKIKAPDKIELMENNNKNFDIESSKLKKEASVLDANIAKNALLPSLKLGIETTRFYQSVEHLHHDEFTIALTMDIPLFRKDLKLESEKQNAYLESQKALLNKKKINSDSQVQILKSSLKRLKEKYDSQIQQIKLQKKKLIESRRLLRAGKMEYERYTQRRDELFRLEAHQHELSSEKISTLLNLAIETGATPKLCSGIESQKI